MWHCEMLEQMRSTNSDGSTVSCQHTEQQRRWHAATNFEHDRFVRYQLQLEHRLDLGEHTAELVRADHERVLQRAASVNSPEENDQ